MSSGYDKKDEAKYKRILSLVCEGFYPECADLEAFITRAIPKLPKKFHKALITYFGIGGGINHEERIEKLIRRGKTILQQDFEMIDNILIACSILGTIDYLILFHSKGRELVEQISRKTSGEKDKLNATKWAELFAVMVINGPHLFFEGESIKPNRSILLRGRKEIINRIFLLKQANDTFFKMLDDGELDINRVKLWTEDLEVNDRVTMLNFFGLQVPKYLKEFSGEKIVNYYDLIKFKEKIFPKGPWATDGYMFLKTGIPDDEVINQFRHIYKLIRSGSKVEMAEPHKYPFSSGIRKVSWLQVGDEYKIYEFPYYEEVMFIRYIEKYINE